MRVDFNTPELAVEPRVWVQYEQVLGMALRPGWVEVGQRHSQMKKTDFQAGEMVLCPRYTKVWLGAHRMERLILTIAALRAANDARAADMRVLDVAMASGFKSQQHFARVFRSVCGASPTEYRREFAHRDQRSAADQSAQLSN